MVKKEHGMVFGVFDRLHAGHQHFLTEAARHCERLTVVVAPDEAVRALKGRSPNQRLSERMEQVKRFNHSFTVCAGDSVQGTWTTLKKYKPDHIFLGYDQQDLARALAEIKVPYSFLNPHQSDTYKSSLLQGNTHPLSAG